MRNRTYYQELKRKAIEAAAKKREAGEKCFAMDRIEREPNQELADWFTKMDEDNYYEWLDI